MVLSLTSHSETGSTKPSTVASMNYGNLIDLRQEGKVPGFTDHCLAMGCQSKLKENRLALRDHSINYCKT